MHHLVHNCCHLCERFMHLAEYPGTLPGFVVRWGGFAAFIAAIACAAQ